MTARFKSSRVQAFNVFGAESKKQMEVFMAVKQFEDLEVWKEARRLTQIIYRLTKEDKFSKDFALRDQIQRAAVSIMSL